MSGRVVVVGGGLAGMSAALRLCRRRAAGDAARGRPRLGGATFSFDHGGLTSTTDSTSSCAAAPLSAVPRPARRERPGPAAAPHGRAGGRRGQWATAPAAAQRPAGTAAAGRFGAALPALSPAQRVRLGRAVLALRGVDRESAATDDTSFGDWLRAHGQDARTIEAVWDLIGVATLNARADDASLALAATVFQVGLLSSSAGGRPRLVPGPAVAAARRAVGAGTRRAGRDGRSPEPRSSSCSEPRGGWTVRVREREDLHADVVVLAVPPATAERLLPAGATDLPEGWSARLGAAPIVNAHVVYDRRVLDEPFTAVVGTAVPWVFDCTEPTGVRKGQCLGDLDLRGATTWSTLPVAELRDPGHAALDRALPAVRDARGRRLLRHPRARGHIRAVAGKSPVPCRPRVTRLPGLFLAGAWTDTGWPATMEGAVRSGEAAVEAVPAHVPAQPRRAERSAAVIDDTAVTA